MNKRTPNNRKYMNVFWGYTWIYYYYYCDYSAYSLHNGTFSGCSQCSEHSVDWKILLSFCTAPTRWHKERASESTEMHVPNMFYWFQNSTEFLTSVDIFHRVWQKHTNTQCVEYEENRQHFECASFLPLEIDAIDKRIECIAIQNTKNLSTLVCWGNT